VMSPAVAYVTTRLLQSVFDSGGTAHRVAGMLGRPVAGKTGTTNSDAWFVGYTPELTTAVWVGYDRGRSISSSEAHRAAPIFADFTEMALKSRPPVEFNIPEGVVSVYIDPMSGMLASPGCPTPVLETFLAGTEPTDRCPIHGAATAEEPQSGKSGGWWKKVRHWWGG
jgi:membrane carboxypeptidase/penicillin-binding protein